MPEAVARSFSCTKLIKRLSMSGTFMLIMAWRATKSGVATKKLGAKGISANSGTEIPVVRTIPRILPILEASLGAARNATAATRFETACKVPIGPLSIPNLFQKYTGNSGIVSPAPNPTKIFTSMNFVITFLDSILNLDRPFRSLRTSCTNRIGTAAKSVTIPPITIVICRAVSRLT